MIVGTLTINTHEEKEEEEDMYKEFYKAFGGEDPIGYSRSRHRRPNEQCE